ncbi:DUF4376 domain-containing protein [Pseudomonas sp.]|uniref:DUF4376 domain-containing protein n=1 Tax=Pseudomonas sp. TaxID=306 RepID=UPI00258ECEA7|nr:DUF4376 domain-containing protein [Pseudomonas sp.]
MNIYELINGIWTGNSKEVTPFDGRPLNWVRTDVEPPSLSGTEVARWTGEDWETLAELPAPPVPSLDWPALIATRRWLAETSGTTFGGMPIDTDDRSKLLINGAALRADRSADYVLRWKTSQGFVDLTAAQVLAVADAVSEHVQLCFDREDALLVAVADGSITAEMLEEGWPA